MDIDSECFDHGASASPAARFGGVGPQRRGLPRTASKTSATKLPTAVRWRGAVHACVTRKEYDRLLPERMAT